LSLLSPPLSTPISWKKILRENFTDWKKLATYLELTSLQQESILQNPNFPLNIPLRLAQKITKGTLEDPILKQFLPLKEELANKLGFIQDPVGDNACRLEPKLLHKYEGRVLLLCTSACAMHCRFCFRQNFDYDTGETKLFDKELAFIASDTTIHEVILSGGDPLSLSDQALQSLFDKLSVIPHVTRIRFHTRFPIGIPERLDDNFLNVLKSIPQHIWFVIHCNHPNELDDDILQRLKKLQKLGITVLCQTVLLHGVNDTAPVLKDLCERLVDHGILPYYLHQLDRVKGSAHFEVSEEEGLRLIDEISRVLPGYAVPKYVREIAGEGSKSPIN